LADRSRDLAANADSCVTILVQHRRWLKIVDEWIARSRMGFTAIATAALLSHMALLKDTAFLRDAAFLCGTAAASLGPAGVAAEDRVQQRIDPVQHGRKYTRQANRAASATATLRTAAFLCDAAFLEDVTLLKDAALLNDLGFLNDCALLMDVAFLGDVSALLSRTTAAAIEQSVTREGGAWCCRQQRNGEQAECSLCKLHP
jgi:hypothetical protein